MAHCDPAGLQPPTMLAPCSSVQCLFWKRQLGCLQARPGPDLCIQSSRAGDLAAGCDHSLHRSTRRPSQTQGHISHALSALPQKSRTQYPHSKSAQPCTSQNILRQQHTPVNRGPSTYHSAHAMRCAGAQTLDATAHWCHSNTDPWVHSHCSKNCCRAPLPHPKHNPPSPTQHPHLQQLSRGYACNASHADACASLQVLLGAGKCCTCTTEHLVYAAAAGFCIHRMMLGCGTASLISLWGSTTAPFMYSSSCRHNHSGTRVHTRSHSSFATQHALTSSQSTGAH